MRNTNLFKLWGISHLLIIFIVGLCSVANSYLSFYYPEKTKEYALLNKLNDLLDVSPVAYYTTNTGTNTGYGFFAPNVASGFVVVYTFEDECGNIIKKTTMPNFKNKESIRKYSTALSVYLDEVTTEPDSMPILKRKYIDAITNTLSKRVMQTEKSAEGLIVQIYLHDFPSIAEYAEGNKDNRLILIKERRYDI